MKNLLIIGIIFYMATLPGYSTKLGTLSEITDPESLIVSQQGIFVYNDASIYHYSLAGLKLLKKLGREGEGPGEFKTSRFVPNTMILADGSILVDTRDKLVYFSQQGELKKEIKKHGLLVTQMTPIGNNFVIKYLDRNDQKREFIVISLVDSSLKIFKEIHRQISPVQFMTYDMIPDSVHYCVVGGNRLVLEKSLMGFHLEVYNESGKKLKTITHPVASIPVTIADREKALDFYRSDPVVKQIGFENLKSRIKYKYPQIFPAIHSVYSFGNNICVKTFARKEGQQKYYILDLKGNIVKTFFLPVLKPTPLGAKNNGINQALFAGFNGQILYLLENDEEEWELWVKNLN